MRALLIVWGSLCLAFGLILVFGFIKFFDRIAKMPIPDEGEQSKFGNKRPLPR